MEAACHDLRFSYSCTGEREYRACDTDLSLFLSRAAFYRVPSEERLRGIML